MLEHGEVPHVDTSMDVAPRIYEVETVSMGDILKVLKVENLTQG